MTFLEGYIFRLVCCAVVCNIVLAIQPDGTAKNIVHLVAGILLTITVLSPLRNIQIPDMASMDSGYFQEGHFAASQGEDYLKNSCTEIITSELQAYILDKAQMLGCSIQASVALDGEGCPDYIVISGSVSPEHRKELEDILIKDLGITREDCRWSGSVTPLP